MLQFVCRTILLSVPLCFDSWAFEGPSPPPSAAAEIANQAHAEIHKGEFAAAESRVRAALAESPVTNDAGAMILFGELGQALLAQNRFDEAEQNLRKAAAIGEKLDSPAPASVALVLQNLGAVLERRSLYKDAGEIYLRARAILTAAGRLETHCGGAISRRLAICALRQGRFAEARTAIEQALGIVRTADGSASADYGAALADKAIVEFEMGRYDQSIVTGTESLRIQAASPSADFDRTGTLSRIGTLNNVGVALDILGRTQDARSYFRQSIDLWRRRKSEIPAVVPRALHNLAVVEAALGRIESARQLELEALHVTESISGKRCFERVASINNLGMIALRGGQTREAQALFSEASQLAAELRGPDTSEYASTISNLAAVQFRLRHFRKAAELDEKALSIASARLGPAHTAVASIEANLGVELYHLKRFDEAERHLRLAISVQQERFSESSERTAETLHNLAVVLTVQKKLDRASQIYSRAVRAQEGSPGGAADPKLVAWVRELASALRGQGRFAEAEIEELHATRLEVTNAIRLEKMARQPSVPDPVEAAR